MFGKVLAMASGRAERQKVPRKSPRHDQKSDAGGAGLKLVKEFICFSAIQKLRNIVYMSNKMRKFAGAKVLCHGKRREIQTVETAN